MTNQSLLITVSILTLVVSGSLLSNLVTAESPLDDDKKAKQVKIGGINFYVDYDAALKVAKEKNQPVWLHFGENPG